MRELCRGRHEEGFLLVHYRCGTKRQLKVAAIVKTEFGVEQLVSVQHDLLQAVISHRESQVEP